MSRPPKRKRGGNAKYVLDRHGRPIVGLSFDKALNQYYSTHVRPKKYFGTDFDQAVNKFRRWQLSRDTVFLPHLAPLIPKVDQEESVAEGWITQEQAEKLLPWPGDVPADAFYDLCRELILKNPAQFAERVGIPQIASLENLEPPGPSLTLKEVGDLYSEKRKRPSDHWRRKQKAYWEEFATRTKAKRLRDIDAKAVARYHDAVWDTYEKEDRSPTYVSHRLQAVRTILRHALKCGRNQRNVRRVLDLCAIFELPRKTGTDPRPIARVDFQKLLDASPPKWQAVLLLALNCAFYPSEVAAVQRSHIDIDGKKLVMDRGKTGVPRIAVLWDRTIEAIHAYERAEPHQSDHIFVSENGLPYNGNHIGRNFRRRRVEAEVDESVTFDMIRDGAYTSAIQGGADLNQARMLAGHRVGISDAYLKRDPGMVADACAAIEAAYFGKPPVSEQPAGEK